MNTVSICKLVFAIRIRIVQTILKELFTLYIYIYIYSREVIINKILPLGHKILIKYFSQMRLISLYKKDANSYNYLFCIRVHLY
jgi:hypothetical protein